MFSFLCCCSWGNWYNVFSWLYFYLPYLGARSAFQKMIRIQCKKIVLKRGGIDFQRLIHTSLLNVSIGVFDAQFTKCYGTFIFQLRFSALYMRGFRPQIYYLAHPDPHSALDSLPFTTTQSMYPQHWLSYWRILLLICEEFSLMLQQLRMLNPVAPDWFWPFFAFIDSLGSKNRMIRLICLIAWLVDVPIYHRHKDANFSEDLHLD